MEKRITGTETPITFPGTTIIPLWEISLHYSTSAGITFSGSKKAIGIVIINTKHTKVFRVNGEKVPLDTILLEVPGLKEAMEKV
jgi:hypothetical protein